MKLAKPKITKPTLHPVAIAQLLPEATLERIVMTSVDASGTHMQNLSLDEALLERVLLVEAHAEKLSIIDAALKACDFSAARCSEGSYIRVHITGGRMTGVDLSRSTLKDVVFEDCKLDMANFRFAKLTRVQFINCKMTDTDFQAATLTNVTFQTSQLEKAIFSHCTLKDVDARSSELLDIRGWQFLKGLTIDTTQLLAIAPQLALELGLKVDD